MNRWLQPAWRFVACPVCGKPPFAACWPNTTDAHAARKQAAEDAIRKGAEE